MSCIETWHASDLVLTTLLLCHSFLGYVDKLGVAYEAPTVATGFGAYLAQVGPSPLMWFFKPLDVLGYMVSVLCLCVCVATNEGGGREQGRHQSTGGPGPCGALPQSALLPRCSFLQQGKWLRHHWCYIRSRTLRNWLANCKRVLVVPDTDELAIFFFFPSMKSPSWLLTALKSWAPCPLKPIGTSLTWSGEAKQRLRAFWSPFSE